ncbi:MAG: HNH endonuclease [Lachnospiraceae bacterium]|nr:HNH endonuclease [Lachnospiraceae bacterium]
MQNRWTREEEIIVFNLYCKIPFQKSSKNHPEVIRIAKLINRTPSAVNMKIGNFGSFDETLQAQGITGLVNASKLDKEIWDEFNGRWDILSYESEKLIFSLEGKDIEEQFVYDNVPQGKDIIVEVKQRINQNFFRQAVLASYNNACCITGLNTSALLVASHIKPWSVCNANEKTNPCNGICLNALHDKAFDRGYLTITPEYKVHISSDISDLYDGKTVEKLFSSYDNKHIMIPEKFAPSKDYLLFHNDTIFENWR